MKHNTFFLRIFFIAIVSGATLSSRAFAQNQSSLHLSDGPKTVQQQSVEEDPALQAFDGVYAIDTGEYRAGQFDESRFLQQAADGSAAFSASADTTVIYDTGQNQDRVWARGAAGNIMAQRYEVPRGGRLTSVLVAPVYDNQFENSTAPAGAPRDFTLKIWNVTVNGLPGDELYSMDVDEAVSVSHIDQVNEEFIYSFLQVDFPDDTEALTTLPSRIFVGLTDKGTDENYLVFATSRRKDTAPGDAAYSYETINSNTKWYVLANLITDQGLELGDQVFPIRPRFVVSGDTHFEETILVYDSGRNDDEIYVSGDAEDIMAQRYDVIPGARLASVLVAPVYDNQFANSAVSASAPRDFTLRIWDVAVNGLPGDELYSMDVDDDVVVRHVRSDHTYAFLRIDLPVEEDIFSALPDRIFIGLANKGTDENYLATTSSRRISTAPVDAAYLYTTIDSTTLWSNFATLGVNNLSLRDQVFPIRALFLSSSGPVSIDDPVEIPSGVELAQNYPNPFNPVTSISWVQPVSAHVRLSVFNLLGQQMAIPVDGAYPAGAHEIRLDASGWSSGVYIYAIETGTRRLTRRMVLLK